MTSATVTSKGQITIPAEVRERLGLRPGSRVAFVPTTSGAYVFRTDAGSITELKGSVPARERPVSIDEMNDAIAGGAAGETR